MIYGYINYDGNLEVKMTRQLPKAVVKLIGKVIAFPAGITLPVGYPVRAYVKIEDKRPVIVDWKWWDESNNSI